MIFHLVRVLFAGRRLRFALPLSAAVILGAPPFSFAADEKKPAEAAALAPAFPETPRYRELWVPTDQLGAVLKKMPRAVMLTPEQYRTLLRDAENGESSDDPNLKPPVAAVIREAAYDGELTNEVARINARYQVESFTDEWTEIPLVLPRAQLAHVEVDAETAIRVAPPAKGKTPDPILLVRGKGEHTVVAEFHLPVSRSPAGNAIQLTSPGVAAASLKLTLPGGAKLDSELPFTTGEEDANTARFVLPAEPGRNYEIRWTARNIDAIPEAAIFQTCRYLYSIDSTRVQADLGLVLSSSLAELPNRFQITLPEGVRILSVEGSEVLSWDGIATNSGTGIEVVLVKGERQAADIRILAEADIGADADADVTVALPVADVADVHRASGTMALIGSDDVRVKNITTGPLTVAAPDALEPALRDHPHFVAGFRFPVTTAPPEITLSPVRERFNVQLDTHISLKREAIHLTRQLTIIPLEGRLFATELELPDGEELLRIDGPEAGFTWNRIEGNRVRLAWQQGLIVGDADVDLDVLTRRDPEGWFELGEEPQPLAFENAAVAAAEVVSGYVAVNFDDSFRVETVTADGLEPRDGRTTPVTGQLAWFRLSDYQLELNAARRATEIEASVTAYAVPLQSTLEVEGQLDLEIRYTPVSEIVVKLDPAVADTVRWDSPLLAEKRLNEETGEWTLDFHEELGGFQRLRFRMALPFEMEDADGDTEQKNFAVSAPVFSVPTAKRLRGDWIIEANTDTELNFETNGVDAVDSLRVPAVAGYQPRHRIIAAYQYRGDAYELKIAGTRHAPEDLVTTVIDTLRLDTVVSTDGPDRHQVLLDLRTSGEQFLEVGLPEGAVLWTLTVDGEAVKPVRSESGALRIQLPALQDAGQQSILLKLVYQTPGGEWGGSGRETLEPVRLAGRIPVMRTRWFLHLPEGFDYQKFSSNLREDFEIVDRTLLGQVWDEGMLFPDRPMAAIGGEADSAPPQLVAVVPVNTTATQPEAEADMSELAKADAVFADVPRKPKAAAPAIGSANVNAMESDRIASIERKFKTIIIPSIEFSDTPLADALDFLRQQAVELDTDPDPNNRGIDFVLNFGTTLDTGSPGAKDTKITLQLSNVPLGEALGYTLKLANLKYRVEPQAVVVLPLSAPDSSLYTSTYVVPPSFLSSAPGGGGGGAAAADPFAAPAPSAAPQAGQAARETAKNILEAYGVQFGPGASAQYDPRTGQLIVRNTQEQTDYVEALTQSLRSGGFSVPPGMEPAPRGIDADSIDALIQGSAGNRPATLGGGPVVAGIQLPDEPASLVDSESGEEVMIGGSVQATSRAWNDLVIEDLTIEGMPLSEAIDLLQQQAREADPTGVHAAASRIDFNGTGVPDTPINLKLENVSASEALRKLTEVSGTQYRVTAGGIVIAAPGQLPPESLDTLVVELPHAAFEKSDGNGGTRRLSARHLLIDAGVEFPPGTSAAYNFTTRRLAVKNTPANLEAIRNVFGSYLAGAGDAFAAGRGQTQQVLAAAQALGLKGFEFRHAGLIPLDFELPESGRSYSFSGLYAPEPIDFRYVNWERQLRMAWFWMLVAGLAFWFGAVRKWQRPILLGILGVIILTFIPLIISESLLAFCNSLLLGWLTAAGLWVVWKICDRFSRKLGHPKNGETEKAGEAAATTV